MASGDTTGDVGRARGPGAGDYPVHDPAVAERLAEHGYAVVPFLTPAELAQLRAVRERLGPAPGDPRSGFHSDAWSSAPEFRRTVSDELAAALAGPIARCSDRYRLFAVAHLVKWPGEPGSVVAHRDPSFVDERQHRSITIWCPLEDVSGLRGGLWVVPGSHRSAVGHRHHDDPHNMFPEVGPGLEDRAVAVDLPAGSAVLFDHATIHCSGPTDGGRERVVVAALLAPEGARLSYGVRRPDGPAQRIEVDPSFFVDFRLSDLDVERALATYPILVEV